MDEWKYGRKLFKDNKEKRDTFVMVSFCIVSAVLMFGVVII